MFSKMYRVDLHTKSHKLSFANQKSQVNTITILRGFFHTSCVLIYLTICHKVSQGDKTKKCSYTAKNQ